MPAGDFIRYVDQLTNVEYYKYDVIVNYFDLRFKYKNLGANNNGTFTLKIEGVVDFVEPREYLIYSKTKPTSDSTVWVVRVPEISNNQIPVWNPGASTYNVSKVPWRQFIDRGLNYNVNTADKFNTEGPVSKYIGIYQNTLVDYAGGGGGNNIILFSDPQQGQSGPNFIVTNTSAVIADFVQANFYRYNRQHPCIVVNYDPPPGTSGNSQSEQEYFEIPIGVTRYKVTLTNNQNQEKVVSYIEGTLWQNPVYSPLQQITYTLTPPTSSAATLTLNLYNPAGPGNPNGGNNNNTTITGVPPQAGYVNDRGFVNVTPAQYDQGQGLDDDSSGTVTVGGTTIGTARYPDVIGVRYTIAISNLTAAGFNNVTAQQGTAAPNSGLSNTVYVQSPVAGTNARFVDVNRNIVLTYYGPAPSGTGGTTGGGTGGSGGGGTGTGGPQ